MTEQMRGSSAASQSKDDSSTTGQLLGPGVVADDVFTLLKPVVSLLAKLVGPHLEVVLHDLSKPETSVMAIANGQVSGRSVGDSILSGPREDAGFRELHKHVEGSGRIQWQMIDNYQTTSASGQRLRSATLLLRDGDGTPIAALCLNADLTVFEMAHGWLERMLHLETDNEPLQSDPDEVDLQSMMQDIIDDTVRHFMKRPEFMSKKERLYAVEAMMQRGLFLVRNSVSQVAEALGVSRFTIYNYIDEIKHKTANASAEPDHEKSSDPVE